MERDWVRIWSEGVSLQRLIKELDSPLRLLMHAHSRMNVEYHELGEFYEILRFENLSGTDFEDCFREEIDAVKRAVLALHDGLEVLQGLKEYAAAEWHTANNIDDLPYLVDATIAAERLTIHLIAGFVTKGVNTAGEWEKVEKRIEEINQSISSGLERLWAEPQVSSFISKTAIAELRRDTSPGKANVDEPSIPDSASPRNIASPETQAAANRPRVSQKTVDDLLRMIRDKPNSKAITLSNAFNLRESTFKSNYVPHLKARGVKNDGDGYYLPESEAN